MTLRQQPLERGRGEGGAMAEGRGRGRAETEQFWSKEKGMVGGRGWVEAETWEWLLRSKLEKSEEGPG